MLLAVWSTHYSQQADWRVSYANTWIMNLYLKDFAKQLPSNTHALMVMDGAGWHRSIELEIPENVSILLLPPYSPELNPVERVWKNLRYRVTHNTFFENLEALENAVVEYLKEHAKPNKRLTSLCCIK